MKMPRRSAMVVFRLALTAIAALSTILALAGSGSAATKENLRLKAEKVLNQCDDNSFDDYKARIALQDKWILVVSYTNDSVEHFEVLDIEKANKLDVEFGELVASCSVSCHGWVSRAKDGFHEQTGLSGGRIQLCLKEEDQPSALKHLKAFVRSIPHVLEPEPEPLRPAETSQVPTPPSPTRSPFANPVYDPSLKQTFDHRYDPYCGGPGMVSCPIGRDCGSPDTIACPPTPGSPPSRQPTAAKCGGFQQRACRTGLPCGGERGQLCASASIAAANRQLAPTSPGEAVVPFGPAGGGNVGPVTGSGGASMVATPTGNGDEVATGEGSYDPLFAATPVPDEEALKRCKFTFPSRLDEANFYDCVMGTALPAFYRLTRHCLQKNPEDYAGAVVCTSGSADAQRAYSEYKRVQRCGSVSRTKAEAAACAADPYLGRNEAYYVNCIAKNNGDVTKSAMCALFKNLTPEQQIAISCAVQTGAQPHAFVVCTGGQLLKRELDKCLDYGIATANGCMGENNEFRKAANMADGELRTIFGDHSAVYQQWVLYKNNVMMPGQNHVAVRAFNTALNDVRSGRLGPGNDIVKAARAIQDTLGRAFAPLGFHL